MPQNDLAPIVVLIHGMGTGARGWAPQIEALSLGRRPVALSMPGYDDEPGPFSIRAACNGVHRVIGAMPGEARVALCGLSLGALVALRVACDDPTRVSALMAVAGFAYLPEEMRQQQLALAEQVHTVPAEQFRARVVAGLVQSVPDDSRADSSAALARFGPDSMANLIGEAACFDLVGELVNLAVPTLVAYGEHDVVNRPLCEDLAARVDHARVASVPGAGHIANLDAPEPFNQVLTSFLGQAGC